MIEEKQIHGKIIANSANIEGINVVNLVSQKSTVTDSKGEFFISVKVGDLLVFSAVDIEIKRILVEDEDLKREQITVYVIPKITELKEVIINKNPQITAENLGIISKNIKRYSPAERRLMEAKALPINALLNIISGRMAMLKKELIVEKKETLLGKIEYFFDDKYYTETLKIPVEYIKGFQYYCIEDSDFVASIKSKNKFMTMFRIVKLAENYNQIIANEMGKTKIQSKHE